MNISILEKTFGSYEGKPVSEYTLRNKNGMQVSVINYGGTITRIITADKHHLFANVINGFNDLEGYLQKGDQYIGSIAGRYCNRIANGLFLLDGKDYILAKNNNNNSLHGGLKGFDKAWWQIEKRDTDGSLTLTYLSKDGEEGFPGNLDVTVIYTLTDDNALKIDYTAITDKPTPVNLTSHCYFNLSGSNDTPILDHELKLFADNYTKVNEFLIPTGDVVRVKNTGLDFTSAKEVGKDIDPVGGYDHNFIINKQAADEANLAEAASLYDPVSGRFMEMFTTEPAVQFYSGNIKPGPGKQCGLCLEAQHYPNSPNEPSFPGTILRPGEKYRQTTVYKFSTR